MLRPCLGCGALVKGSYCSRCTPAYMRRDPRRGSGWTATKLRNAVMKRDGGRCRALIDGQRCDVRDPAELEVHHVRKLSEGGSNALANAVLLCRKHHRVLERAA